MTAPDDRAAGGARRHRAEPARRVPAQRHRATAVRPRYGRIAAAGTSLVITAIALLGGVGVLPGVGDSSAATVAGSGSTGVRADRADFVASDDGLGAAASPAPTTAPTTGSTTAPTTSPTTDPAPSATTPSAVASPIPAGSGQGHRVVFSQTQQRVWLVGAEGNAQRTYLVSGSVLDNLQPGRYHVYSRSRWAVGIDDSGVMQYFVRFTQGPSGAAIGFHSIPTSHGTALQTVAQLGTPQSHGCIRQQKPDAVAMWSFAPVGTEVDVVA